ncbi:MAG: UPF0262 family protein [Alphaproteobacteria bacterium]|nr:UPF0262 family protein [Alphaproteobacteria bacterium]
MALNFNDNSYINTIRLCQNTPVKGSSLVEQDCQLVLKELELESKFQPIKDKRGPYNITLSSEDNRMVFHIKNSESQELPFLLLSLKPYARLIKDYFIIVQSYDEAVKEGKPSRIEAVDMGRRGLHNEGASLLTDRLKDKILLDHDTARRLFTLICTLHSGMAHVFR